MREHLKLHKQSFDDRAKVILDTLRVSSAVTEYDLYRAYLHLNTEAERYAKMAKMLDGYEFILTKLAQVHAAIAIQSTEKA